MRMVLAGLLLLLGTAAAGAVPPDNVEVSGMGPSQALDDRLVIRADPDRSLDPAELLSAGPGAWRRPPAGILQLSFDDRAHWLRVRLRNAGSRAVERILEVEQPLQDYLEVYIADGDRVRAHYATGDRRPFASRPLAVRDFAFPVVIPAGETRTLLLRLDSHDGLYDSLPVTLWRPAVHQERERADSLAFGAYYGAIATLLLYNLLVFASTRERVFFLYALYLLAFGLWNVSFRGFGLALLWPEAPWLNNQLVPLGTQAIYVTLALFTMEFLNTRETAPRLHRFLQGGAVAMALLAVPALFGVYGPLFAVIMPLGIVFILGILAGAAWLAWRGNRQARIFTLAWALLILGAVVYYLHVAGLLPANVVTEYGLNIASVLEFILLAFGLADKINALKAEKLAAEQKALATERRMTHDLERKVAERTHELEVANQQLTRASTTDELTGLANRRAYAAEAPEAFRSSLAAGEPFTLAIVDVDHFKRYNDRYGHAAGDTVLRGVADILRVEIEGAGGRAFRVGGEEFALTFAGGTPRAVADALERMRRAVRGWGLTHEGNPAGVLTLSAGYARATAPASISLEGLYARADQALYAAKEAGRDRVGAADPEAR